MDQKNKYQDLVQSCRILFNLKGSPVFGNNDSFSISCSEAWIEPLTKLCTKLENLNKWCYPKYRIRISVHDIKSKFGELRFYYDVINEGSKIKKTLSRYIEKLENTLNKINFQVVVKTDIPRHIKHEVREVLKSEYLRAADSNLRCANVITYEVNGHYFDEVWYDISSKTHLEPTRYKFLYHLKEWCRKKTQCFRCSIIGKNEERQKIATMLSDLADYYIRDAEQECACLCEECGTKISEYGDDSKKCTTIGWIEYLCKKCAEKQNHNYMYQDELWNKDKVLKTKKQLEEEKKKEIIKETKVDEEQNKKDKALDNEIKKAIIEESKILMSKENI